MSDQREDVTKKTFGKWLNSHLIDRPNAKIVTDLFHDLRDGHILLDVLEVLTHKSLRHERGNLRVHQLANVNTVLSVLKEHRVKLVNIGNVDIVDGNPKITLALVWAVILHWQFDRVLGEGMKHVSNLETSLLAWCRQSVADYRHRGVNITDFALSWQDGLAFAALVHSAHPELFDWEVLAQKGPRTRLDFIFGRIKETLHIAQLLDAEDMLLARPDKRSVMTYVMCLFHVLPHDNIDMAAIKEVSAAGSDPEIPAADCVGSPLKAPIQELTKGEPMTYAMFCQVHEDALEWLLEVEDKLQQLEPVSSNLTEARNQFLRDGAFMSEVHDQHGSIGEVLSEGSVLIDRVALTASESKDVKIRHKLLSDRWEAFREMALKRQNEQTQVVMKLQELEVAEIRDWMTQTEDRISRMGLVGIALSVVEKQLHEQSKLQKEFESQEVKFSEFIDIVPSSPSKSKSDQAIPGCNGSGDLEGQLMALGERWTVLCGWIEDRWKLLTKVAKTWKKMEKEYTTLDIWLTQVEKSLRQMERSPTDDRVELKNQGKLISSIQEELSRDKEKRLLHLGAVSDDLIDAFERDNHEARAKIEKKMEDIQDRWEILTESMEAQKQRLSSLGFRLKKNPTEILDRLANLPGSGDKAISSVPDVVQTGGDSSEEKGVKKRKITGTKRIEFESQFARVSSWLQQTGPVVADNVNQESFPADGSQEEDKIAFYEDLLGDISAHLPDVEDAVRLGQELMSDIQSEENFPPGYLGNVTDKVASLNTSLSSLQCDQEKLQNRRDYLKCKLKFYHDFETLKTKVRGFEHWLDQLNMDAICRELDSIEIMLDACASKKTMLNSYDHIVRDMKELSNEVTLHPGAMEDPANQVKSDIYEFCDRWDSLENQISQKQSELVKHKRRIQAKDNGGKDTMVSKSMPEEWLDKISAPVFMDTVIKMHDELVVLKSDLDRLADRDDDKTHEVRLQVEARIRTLDILLKSAEKFQEEVDGLSKWMDEVNDFLHAENPAFGDLKTLDAQLKESNALQDDIQTLKPNIIGVNDSARTIIAKCAQGSEMGQDINVQLAKVNQQWEATVVASKTQNDKLSGCQRKSQELYEAVSELTQLLEHLQKDLPQESAVTQASELSQRSYKLMQLKERIERKKASFDHLQTLAESCVHDFHLEASGESNELVDKFRSVAANYEETTHRVQERHVQVKSASSKYGEFKTLAAQESDWLERLEKKLKKSTNSAADAEEISEALDDIENFLNHHPEDRIASLEELAKDLSEQNILISSVTNEAKKLTERWGDLSQRARSRTQVLESSVAEAQQWEYKLIEVQEWLEDKDTLLTSHLEQELTVDDLPDESQKETMLREFEDQENLLSEMDEQVDTYRDAGKHEAAARLEDQLHLIHQRFQELLMKFELFQQQPPVEYEPRLDRVHRQLRDIRQNIYLTDLASSEVEGIQGQLHHAKCIYNALSDIKPEVENVIKVGRKLVDSDAVDNGTELTQKINALKADFNEVGAQVTDAKRNLEKAFGSAEKLHELLNNVQSWLALTDNQISSLERKHTLPFLSEKHKDMFKVREQVKAIQKVQDDFFQMGNPKVLLTLKDNVRGVESRWSKVVARLQSKLQETKKSEAPTKSQESPELNFEVHNLTLSRERTLSTTQDDPPIVNDFRTAFQEASKWLETAEAKLIHPNQSESVQAEAEEWQPKMCSLRRMADKASEMGPGHEDEVQPEMRILVQRWEVIERRLEERMTNGNANKDSSRTTLSLSTNRSPLQSMITSSSEMDEEVIDTLPEDDDGSEKSLTCSNLKRNLPSDLSLSESKRAALLPDTKEPNPALLSSRESSPDMISSAALGNLISETSETMASAELISPTRKKEPPNTLPKPLMSPSKSPPKTMPKPPTPDWFSGEKERFSQSPEKVVVVTKTIADVQKAESPLRAIIPAPRAQPESQAALDDEDEMLAQETVAIEKILSETHAELAEVRRKASYSRFGATLSQDNQSRETKEFRDNVTGMLTKLDKAKGKIEQLDNEKDLGLRQDLIDMETKLMEAEVAALISRGDTLILMTHRKDLALANHLQSHVAKLQAKWVELQQLAADKTSSARKSEVTVQDLALKIEALKTWCDEVNSNLLHSQFISVELLNEIDEKRDAMNEVNNIANTLKSQNAFDSQHQVTLGLVNSQWDKLSSRARQYPLRSSSDEKRSRASPGKSSDVTSSGNPAMGNNAAEEIVMRIAKMREVVAAIDRQFKTQVLANKQFESLPMQASALETVKEALEKLRPSIKKTAKDLDALTGSLSVEYLEKIVGQSEKLKDDWQLVNKRFGERQTLWVSSQEKFSLYQTRLRDLDGWLDHTERVLVQSATNSKAIQERQQIEREVSERNKAVTEFAILGKEIMHKTSAQEHHDIQNQVDKVLKRWKFVLSHLATQRDKMHRDRFMNNLNYINHWIDESVEKIGTPCNPSDATELARAMESLKDLFEPTVIAERRMQVEKLSSSDHATELVEKLEAAFKRLVEAVLPERLAVLREQSDSLKDLLSSVITSNMWTKQMLNKVEDAKLSERANGTKLSSESSAVITKLKQSIKDKEPEVLTIFQRYDMLVQETEEKGFSVEYDLAHRVTNLRKKWNQLYENAHCRPPAQQPRASRSNGHASVQRTQEPAKAPPATERTQATSGRAGRVVQEKSSKAVDATTRHRAPEIYAALRDHRDWIRRKRGELAALNLAGEVDGLSRQSEEHVRFSHQVSERGPVIVDDITSGKELSRDDIRDCLERLEEEWQGLNDAAHTWKNRIDNALANMRIFQTDLKSVHSRLDTMEGTHNAWMNSGTLKDRDLSSPANLEHLQGLSTEVKSLQDMMESLQEQTHRLPPLSPPVALDFERLRERLQRLDRDVQEHQKRLSTPNARPPTILVQNNDPSRELDNFSATLPPGWERGLTEEKIPYFMDHHQEETHWDHPAFKELMKSLLDMNTVKYSAYRLSLKLRKIQQKLCLDLLELDAAVLGFEEHGLSQDRHELAIEVPEMSLVLSTIYGALHEEEPDEVKVALCVDLCLNWLLNVYDSARVGQIRVLSFKIGILLLCRGPLTEKYLHLFKLVAQSRLLSPAQLGILLYDSVQIPKFLGEAAAFGGPNVEPSVRSCFSMAMGSSKKGELLDAGRSHVEAKDFLKWLRREPETLVWLPVLHRLASAELARHSAKCGVCKRCPIVGFRYHCLKCFNFDLCHDCFFVGRTARGHKAEHPMQEYCTSTGASVNLKNFGTAFRNSFRTKKYFLKKQEKLGYLPVQSRSSAGAPSSYQNSSEAIDPNNSSFDSRGEQLGSSFSNTLQPKCISSASSLPNPNSHSEAITSQVRPAPADEHSVIGQLCSILHQVQGGPEGSQERDLSDDETTSELTTHNHSSSSVLTSPNSTLVRRLDEGEDLENIIGELEEQNRLLQEEYESLKASLMRNDASQPVEEALDRDNNNPLNGSLQNENKRLKRDNQRTEARMKILEEHNTKLEDQLNRLKRLVRITADPEGNAMSSNRFGTLQSKAVVATELYADDPDSQGGMDQRTQPQRQPPASDRLANTAGHVKREMNDLVHSLQRDLTDEEEDSLDLSDHETQRLSD